MAVRVYGLIFRNRYIDEHLTFRVRGAVRRLILNPTVSHFLLAIAVVW